MLVHLVADKRHNVLSIVYQLFSFGSIVTLFSQILSFPFLIRYNFKKKNMKRIVLFLAMLFALSSAVFASSDEVITPITSYNSDVVAVSEGYTDYPVSLIATFYDPLGEQITVMERVH